MRLIASLWAAALAVGLLWAQDEPLAAKNQAAKQALLAGRYSEAIMLYRQLVQALPDNPGMRLNLGLALEKAGQPSAAIPELEACTRAQPDFASAWFLLGLAHQQLGQPQQAIAPLRKALELDPNNALAELELGDAELVSGNPRAAAEQFQALAVLHPEMAKAWHGLGLSYLAIGERAFARVNELGAGSGYWYALAAHAQAAQQQYAEALSGYAEAIKAIPSVPGLHAARAAIYRMSGHPDWAAVEDQRELGVRRPDCTTSISACACLSGEWMRALEEARRSATVENLYWGSIAAGKLAEQSFSRLAALPESAEIHELMAEATQRMGRRTEAVNHWRRALALRPGDRRIQGRLAESLLRNREYEEASRMLDRLVKSGPQNGEWQYLLGETLFEQRRADEALPHLQVAQRLRPDHLPTLEVLGRVYLQLGQTAKAIALLERALPVDEGPIQFALSSAYRRVGREEDAQAALARYREITKASGMAAAPAGVIPPP